MSNPIFPDKVEQRRLSDLKPSSRNARRHSKSQVQQIAKSLERFGFNNPVLISDDDEIVAGHGRVEAARLLGLSEVPTLRLSHLSAEERRAYALADNKIALNSEWDSGVLALELQSLIDQSFDLSPLGFSLAEIDQVLDTAKDRKEDEKDTHEADIVPEPQTPTVSRPGDLWRLGRHKLICGDAQLAETYEQLCGDEQIDLVFTDPPYNVVIDGHVGGLGATKHREFAFASGEMNRNEFTSFLTVTLMSMAKHCRDGAIAFVCMDWRHMGEVLKAGEAAFSELKNLCVWNKTNGGMGTFYRSKHELVFVFKVGKAPHVNSFGLGETGRYRTNVWDYAGINTFGTSRMDELTMHPTVKPVALVADAIRDCSKRGDLVLDGFGGSGTTLMAAEITGRRARLIEYDPAYCDTIIARYERFSGQAAVLVASGQSFEDVAEARLSSVQIATA